MTPDLLTLLRQVDTPTVCNAIETAQGRRGFDRFTRRTVLCSDPGAPAIVGYARTAKIAAVVHPQSIIHSMVEYRDGSILAHLGPSDMRVAIGYALAWPERPDLPVDRLDFADLAKLDFEAPDEDRFPPLRLAREVLRTGGLAPCILNAAHEIALDGFIAGQIGFLDMAGLVNDTISHINPQNAQYSLEEVFAADAEARRVARNLIAQR